MGTFRFWGRNHDVFSLQSGLGKLRPKRSMRNLTQLYCAEATTSANFVQTIFSTHFRRGCEQ